MAWTPANSNSVVALGCVGSTLDTACKVQGELTDAMKRSSSNLQICWYGHRQAAQAIPSTSSGKCPLVMDNLLCV